ncbi:MAG: hypothetical protein SVY53_11540 [Chloroflexota bacterium]|nr:hypothetical protein [Chloroflexota bacterium]
MKQDSYETINNLLSSHDPGELRLGLEMVRQEISRVGSSEARPLFEMVCAILYIDALDHPELVSIIDEAISLLVGFGSWVIPILVKDLDSGDLKAQLAIAQALGRIGSDAIDPLMVEYNATDDPARHTFILYTMGKIKSPKIVRAAHLAVGAAGSSDLELRDTATRAIGKFVESIPSSDLPKELRTAYIEKLRHNLADKNAGIRAKAVRSLGKLAKYGHLNKKEMEKLKELCYLILGIDDNFDWDRAFIVRKEAQEALSYLEGSASLSSRRVHAASGQRSSKR